MPLRSTSETLIASVDRDLPASPTFDPWLALLTLTYLHGCHPLQCLPMRSLGALQGQLQCPHLEAQLFNLSPCLGGSRCS